MAKGNHKKIRGKPLTHNLLEHYQPINGVVDEMVDASGNPRPVWRDFIEALEDLGAEKLAQRLTHFAKVIIIDPQKAFAPGRMLPMNATQPLD